ncbi:MAG: M48 family metalloprotease [Cytophagales bacterium]|nr:M48 family metalloprotease [Cytophagales bacterium]
MNIFRLLTMTLVAAGLLCTTSQALQAQSALPNLGDDTAMTLGAERQLGDQIGREIYRDAQYVSDPALDAYLASIWQPLYQQAKKNGALPPEMDAQFAWRLFLIRDKSVNAFALPGGYFGVHLGLLALAETPDEMASVLAHEVTHVTQRHISRGMSKESAQTPWLVASILIGLLAMRSNPQATSAALATGQAVGIQGQLNFSRDFEREADRLGFTLMQPAGYAPEGFVAMFEMLGKASRLSDNGSFPYLRTHPLTTERVADMRARVGALQPTSAMKPPAAVIAARLDLHRFMAARAGVLADQRVDAQKFYLEQAEAAVPSSAQYPAAQYAAALAAWQLRDRAQAQKFYERLRASLNSQTPPAVQEQVRWLGAELQLPTALDIASPNRVEMLYAVRQLLIRPQPRVADLATAASRLQDWTSDNPSDADAWTELARVLQAQGQRTRSAMASAEAFRAQLDDSAALAQYIAVQNLMRQGVPADKVDAAIVDSRVRQLQQRVRDEGTQRKL